MCNQMTAAQARSISKKVQDENKDTFLERTFHDIEKAANAGHDSIIIAYQRMMPKERISYIAEEEGISTLIELGYTFSIDRGALYLRWDDKGYRTLPSW